ncbi:MAG: NTP transferase domain-containing protein [Actinobacteria bacterium]|jgi:molybdopterin-guanine dinucleotide biosynthesis protein A|nr:NTP transferase domain-containing protein [Actinomycetota bacterium]
MPLREVGGLPEPPGSGARVAGILLTGGSSRRFGSAKGLVSMGGSTLAQRTGTVMRYACDVVIEVGAGISDAALKLSDEPRQGPLNALVRGWAGLPASWQDAWILGLACDLPLVDEVVLRSLLHYESPLSVVPLVMGRPQYLCARWTPERLREFERAVLAGERSFVHALTGVEDVTYVPAPTLLGSGGGMTVSPDRLFSDIDTPGDLDQLQVLGLWPYRESARATASVPGQEVTGYKQGRFVPTGTRSMSNVAGRAVRS